MDVLKGILIGVLIGVIVVVLASSLGYVSGVAGQGQSDLQRVATAASSFDDGGSSVGYNPTIGLVQIVLGEDGSRPTILGVLQAFAAGLASFFLGWWLWRLLRGILA